MEKNEGLVSIIMLSHNQARFVEESVRSVIAQTYQNWELLFMDDSSKDETIQLLMQLKEEDDKLRMSYGGELSSRIKVYQNVYEKGEMATLKSALKDARGKWIAFLDAGDVWKPEKLEKQIRFMEEHRHAFSYTNYGIIDKHSKSRGAVISGPKEIDEQLMLKCFWPGMLTVMYDAKKIKKVKVPAFKESNFYALLMRLSEKAKCYLLEENLASNRTKRGLFNGMPLKKKLAWRYEAYRTVEDLGRLMSAVMTVENLWYTMVKRVKYVDRKHQAATAG